eukprot:CAMPEP_0117848168 /NCGR_PEP_ID=MMETSP0949-20121206/20240_1 /TAXON_ID=44440 /ORGANISM="Chattonella subsalsa, Strain CCMP2191" /LENGTH=192 /DNA_ID=CAMNT_0005694937 /DNA_START=117 /DNA_END=695 /DNA_ORIENTATION=-
MDTLSVMSCSSLLTMRPLTGKTSEENLAITQAFGLRPNNNNNNNDSDSNWTLHKLELPKTQKSPESKKPSPTPQKSPRLYASTDKETYAKPILPPHNDWNTTAELSPESSTASLELSIPGIITDQEDDKSITEEQDVLGPLDFRQTLRKKSSKHLKRMSLQLALMDWIFSQLKDFLDKGLHKPAVSKDLFAN